MWLAGMPSVVAEGLPTVVERAEGLRFLGLLPVDAVGDREQVDGDDIALLDPDRLEPERPLAQLAAHRACRLVVFSHRSADTFVLRQLTAGADGYISKEAAPDDVAATLVLVAAGQRAVAGSVAGRLAVTHPELHGNRCWPGIQHGLTRRESEVLVRLGDGCANTDIARALVLGEETVRTHLRSLYRKLGTHDRCGAVTAAFRLGILD